MERVLGTHAKLAELPPGEIVWKPGAFSSPQQLICRVIVIVEKWIKRYLFLQKRWHIYFVFEKISTFGGFVWF